MAGDWIPISTNIHTKPEVLRIASGSSRSRFEVVGLLSAFWSWASDHTEDGRLDGIELEHLETLIGGDRVFWQQVEAVGWLEVTPEGVVVPRFENWMSRGAKRRFKENSRKGRARRAHDVRKMSACDADKMRNTEENSTEEKRDPPIGGSGSRSSANEPEPDAAGDESVEAMRDELEFVAAWNATRGVRKSAKPNLTPSRRRSFRARARDPTWDWRAALAKFPLPCPNGHPDGWLPDLDWFLRPDSVLKIIEGKYDWTRAAGSDAARRDSSGALFDPERASREPDYGKF